MDKLLINCRTTNLNRDLSLLVESGRIEVELLIVTVNREKTLWLNLKENSYYTNVISGNINQQIETDSIMINVNQYSFYFKCYAEQKIIRPTSIVLRNLVTEGYLRNVSRSDNNPHRFLIEKWKTLENKDIKIENR